MVVTGLPLILSWTWAYAMLAQHNQRTHADTAKGRVIPFVIDGLPTFPDISKAADNSQ
jgi:hypothetical protein